jgi:hypothetical protein
MVDLRIEGNLKLASARDVAACIQSEKGSTTGLAPETGPEMKTPDPVT